jgi:hypothetical protein
LLPLYDSGSGLFCAFDSAIDEDKDYSLRSRQAAVGNSAWISIDEARSDEGRDALDIPGVSDVPLVSGMLIPLGEEQPEPEPPPAPVIVNQEKPSDSDDQADELAAKTWAALKKRLTGN